MASALFREGQRFQWQEHESSAIGGTACVVRQLSDREEGLSPEAEDYVAQWLEAKGMSGSFAGEQFSIVLGTDDKYYVSGKEIRITAS